MTLPVTPSLIGGGNPSKTLFSTTNDIINDVSGSPSSAPLTPPPPPSPRSSGLSQTTSTPNLAPYSNKFDDVYDQGLNTLQELLAKKQGIDPDMLAISRGFFKPTKTGSFSESLGNVAEEYGASQREQQKNDVSNVQARMALAKAGSEREREKASEGLMGKLYKNGEQGLEMDPEVAMKLASILKDPKFLQQAQEEQRRKNISNLGSQVLQSSTVIGEDGNPKAQFNINPSAFQAYAKYTGDPLGAAEKFAQTVTSMKKSGMLNTGNADGTPFDALVLMSDQLGKSGPAIKAAAQQYAKQYKTGIMDEEKANTLSQHLLSMATSSMDKNAQMASNETYKNMSLALQNQNKEFMQSLAKERLDLAKSTAEDKKNEKQEKRDQTFTAQEQAMQSMKEKIDEVRNHPGRMSGLTSYDPRQSIRGTDQYGFMANLGVLKSQAFLSQVQQMRGLGALSNKEGAQVANALAAIDAGLSYAEQEKQFNYIMKKMDQGLENIRRLRNGDKPVYGEADTESKSSTPTPTGAPKRKVYIPGKGLVEQ